MALVSRTIGDSRSVKTRNGSVQQTNVVLTRTGRAALRVYTQALRDLLGGLDGDGQSLAADRS